MISSPLYSTQLPPPRRRRNFGWLQTATTLLLLAVAPWTATSSTFGRRALSAATARGGLKLQPDLLLKLRGGSTKSKGTAATSEQEALLHAYQLQQQLYLQSRSFQLRQALIDRGLTALEHTADNAASAAPVAVDWDCLLSTAAHPQSCLYSFDAQVGSKVVAPMENNNNSNKNTASNTITLTALNRLRRNDPTKVEPLWHSKYKILQTWFHPTHPLSMYAHLDATGLVTAFLLDRPVILMTSLLMTVAFGFLLTWPFWEGVLQQAVTSKLVWRNWPHWGRFLHAALPLRLLLAQMAYKALAGLLGRVYQAIRTQLVELECQCLEASLPLTVLPDEEEEDIDEDEDE